MDHALEIPERSALLLPGLCGNRQSVRRDARRRSADRIVSKALIVYGRGSGETSSSPEPLSTARSRFPRASYYIRFATLRGWPMGPFREAAPRRIAVAPPTRR